MPETVELSLPETESLKSVKGKQPLRSAVMTSTHPSVSTEDLKQIRQLKKQIRAYVRNHGTAAEIKLLQKAFREIEEYHAPQMRLSGQPAIIHLLRVASQICHVGLDAPTVIAALLHDAVEDTPITKRHIEEEYSPWYARIVEGLTKVHYTENDIRQSQTNQEATYQRMLSALAWDVRVLFIKMFDRLDNMRDMDAMPRHKKRRISRETLDIYVPMARRLGLTEISLEHTELCFRNLYPKR